MAFFLSPVLNEQQFDANGEPRAGALINTYLAGTLTAVTTYKTSTGTAHTNPIQLDSSGNYPNGTQLWLLGGFAYKFVITDSDGANSRTYDNITGVGDTNTSPDQFPYITGTPTYINATSFSLAGDQTNDAQIQRRIRSLNSGGTIYSTISNAVFAAGVTTVTVVNDSGVLDAGLSQVNYALLTPLNPSVPTSYAKSGANADITSLTGLTTPLSKAQGGTASATARIIAQIANTTTGTLATGGAVPIPYDNTIPEITEGDQYMSLAFTPINAASTLEIDVVLFGSHSAGSGYLAAALFQDAITNALSAGGVFMLTATGPIEISFKCVVSAASVTARTYRVRAGSNNAGTFTFNGSGGAQYYGGVMASSLTVKEYLP